MRIMEYLRFVRSVDQFNKEILLDIDSTDGAKLLTAETAYAVRTVDFCVLFGFFGFYSDRVTWA